MALQVTESNGCHRIVGAWMVLALDVARKQPLTTDFAGAMIVMECENYKRLNVTTNVAAVMLAVLIQRVAMSSTTRTDSLSSLRSLHFSLSEPFGAFRVIELAT
jgi:hypothetical protein